MMLHLCGVLKHQFIQKALLNDNKQKQKMELNVFSNVDVMYMVRNE